MVSNTNTKTKNIQVRIDSELKDEADELFEMLGTSTNEAIKIFLKTAIRQRGIPFSVSLNQPNKQTQQAIQEAYSILDGTIESPAFETIDELMEDLES